MEKETVTFVRTKRGLNYGYFIVALSFIALFASMGIRGSFGTYVAGWEQTFSVNRVWVSIVSFTSLFIYGVHDLFKDIWRKKYGLFIWDD